jgi:hypothetical protein
MCTLYRFKEGCVYRCYEDIKERTQNEGELEVLTAVPVGTAIVRSVYRRATDWTAGVRFLAWKDSIFFSTASRLALGLWFLGVKL